METTKIIETQAEALKSSIATIAEKDKIISTLEKKLAEKSTPTTVNESPTSKKEPAMITFSAPVRTVFDVVYARKPLVPEIEILETDLEGIKKLIEKGYRLK